MKRAATNTGDETACVVRRRARLALALVALPLAAAAQSGDDALSPFLGTWSGVFTTQDDEFWGVEDFVCFPGCGKATRTHIIELLDDPANDKFPVGALMGMTFEFEAESLASIMTPAGIEAQKANDLTNDPKLHCEPYGFVREATNPLPMTIRRDDGDLVIKYEEWSLLRTIYMNEGSHPAHRTPSLLGHSIGRIDDDGTLIVETAHVNPGWISDASHAGHSGELTAVERYSIEEDPRRLELEMTLEDPLTLTEPYVVVKTWLYTPDVELVQDVCGEMPGKF